MHDMTKRSERKWRSVGKLAHSADRCTGLIADNIRAGCLRYTRVYINSTQQSADEKGVYCWYVYTP